MITIKCPACQADYSLSPDLAGRKVQCEFCREKFRVPESQATNANAPESKQSPAAFSSSRIEARCPRCLAEYKLAAKYAGQSVRCRDCKSIFKVAKTNHEPDLPQNVTPADDDDLLIDVTPAHFFDTTTPRSAAAQPSEAEFDPLAPNEYDLAASPPSARPQKTGGFYANVTDPEERRKMTAGATQFAPTGRSADWDSFSPAPTRNKPKFGTDNTPFFKRLMTAILVIVVFCGRAWLRIEARQARNRNRNVPNAAPVKPNDIGQQFPLIEAKRQADRARRGNPALRTAPLKPQPGINFEPQGGPPSGPNRFPLPKKPEDMPKGPGQGRPLGPPGQVGQPPFF